MCFVLWLCVNRRRVRQRVQPALPTRVRYPRYCRTHRFDIGAAVVGYRLTDVHHAGMAFRGVITDYDDSMAIYGAYLVVWDDHAEGLLDWWPRYLLRVWAAPCSTNLGRRRVRE